MSCANGPKRLSVVIFKGLSLVHGNIENIPVTLLLQQYYYYYHLGRASPIPVKSLVY